MHNENLDFFTHLKSRGILNTKSSMYSISDEYVYFWLYNLSGQICGYQRYYWKGDKKANTLDKNPKYYSVITKDGNASRLAVWGLETYSPKLPLFIVEGIFDAIPIHMLGYPCIAVLGCSPYNLNEWLNTLYAKKIAVLDGDPSGFKLAKVANDYISLPNGLDPGDFMSIGREKLKELNKLLEGKI